MKNSIFDNLKVNGSINFILKKGILLKKLAIDLLWLKPGKSGGTEAYIRNLLDGLIMLKTDVKFILITSQDNNATFLSYDKYNNFSIIKTSVKSQHPLKRIVWENLFFEKLLKKLNVKTVFFPVYHAKPFFFSKKIRNIVIVHDLFPYNFPEYYSNKKLLWAKLTMKRAFTTASRIVAISDYVKKDAVRKFNISESKIETIYNPVKVSSKYIDFKILKDRYRLEPNKYFYTVSPFSKHKNLETIIRVISEIKNKNIELPSKLVISGVGGKNVGKLKELIIKEELENDIILTGFVSDAEKDTLIKNCHTFLFPSIHEGFGMPPVEAMIIGASVVTTKETSIPEITQNKASYVEDPFDIKKWIDKIKTAKKVNFENCYKIKMIAEEYLKLFNSIF